MKNKLLGLLLVAITSSANAQNFSKMQRELIMSESAEKPMRVFLLTNNADSLMLRQQSEKVTFDVNDTLLTHFTKRLYATVTDTKTMGVGIAAPQVGILKRIIWVQRFDKKGYPFEVYYNPEVVQYSKKTQDCPEGCLSIPGKRAITTDRSYAILLGYDKPDGGRVMELVEDFTAVIFQHEIDHLNGIVFLDHLLKESKKE